ncbi:uncharacterized protein K444DRAFT_224380 [Hyaloscypha bicolor E]|uniref:Uncharacterized protein n=1 Tax=Hyaloscypha bicolor E TaxID=1095630 RepID=A0A2J6SJY8_9HELO|nr:uncharacterized protein K444DRAFT_224380 [Hyaloscypha bicolor E]PMD51089.1 hypothetical protein K444DRAFT_224380 [Hyaloscypha bicolor E]
MRGSGRYLISSWRRTRRRIKESLVLALAAPENIGRGRKTSFSAQQAHRLTPAHKSSPGMPPRPRILSFVLIERRL